LASESKGPGRTRYAAVLPLQCSRNQPRLEVIDLFLQRAADQFFRYAVQFFEFVYDDATTEPQTFQLRLTCGLTYILICSAV
jgi:hypothetical protein